MPGQELESLRVTKPPRRPVAALSMGAAQTPVVVCDDGTAWLWGVAPSVQDSLDEHGRFRLSTDASFRTSLPHTWVQFHTPIPGSEAYADYAET